MASYFDIRGFPKVIAGLLTVAALTVTGILKLPAQGTGRLLFTDASKAVSSTSRLLADGNTGQITVSSCIGCGGSGSVTTTQTGITDKQVVFSNNGFLVGSPGLTYSSTTGILSVSSTNPVNFAALNITAASTTVQLDVYNSATHTGVLAEEYSFRDDGFGVQTGPIQLSLSQNPTSTLAIKSSINGFGNLNVASINATGTLTVGSSATVAGQLTVQGAGTAINVPGGFVRAIATVPGGNISFSTLSLATAGMSYDTAYSATYLQNTGSNVFRLTTTSTMFSTNLLPTSTNAVDIGSFNALPFRNVYATGTEIVFSGISQNPATDDFVCQSATGTLRHETASCTISSARFKENINSLDSKKLLEETLKLRAVSFDWKEGYAPNHGVNGGGKESSGFIAEEVAMIDPQLVVYEESSAEDLVWEKANYPDAILYKDGKALVPKTVDYARVTYVLTGAIQALAERQSFFESLLSAIKSFLHLK